MPGPKNAREAFSWIKEAIRESRYLRTRHLFDRMAGRAVSRLAVLGAIGRASRVEPHDAMPQHGGTCWRVQGRDADGRLLAVGVEAYLDADQRWAVLITVIELKRIR